MATQKIGLKLPTQKKNEEPIKENVVTSAIADVATPKKENILTDTLSGYDSTKKKEVSSAFNEKRIQLDKIIYNEKNDYPCEESYIEELAESILRSGLEHNLSVRYDEESDKYILIAGESRTRAIRLLIEEFKTIDTDMAYDPTSREGKYMREVFPFLKEGVPCKIRSNESDDIDDEIALIETNEITRPSDPVRRAKKIERLNELYAEKGYNSNKRAEMIAESMNITKRQAINYQNISKLIPELKDAFSESKITLKEGSAISSLSEEEQYNILELLNSHDNISKGAIEAARKEAKERDEKVQSINKQLKEIEEQLKRSEEEKAILEKEQSTVIEKKVSQKVEEEIAKVNSIAEQKDEEISGLKDKVKSTEKGYESMLNAKKTTITSLQDEIKKLNSELEKSKKEKQNATNQMVEKLEVQLIVKEFIKTVERTTSAINKSIDLIDNNDREELRSKLDTLLQLV